MPPKKLRKKLKKKQLITDPNFQTMDAVEQEEFKGPLTVDHFEKPEDFEKVEALDEDEQENRTNVVDGEIESIESILTEKEYKVVTEKEEFPEGAKEGFTHMILLSIVPQTEVKFVIQDMAKDTTSHLRCLPPLELQILLPEAYPIKCAPLFRLVEGQIYEDKREFLHSKLAAYWAEECPVIYQMSEYIQNDFLQEFFQDHPIEESKGIDEELQGKVILAYKSS